MNLASRQTAYVSQKTIQVVKTTGYVCLVAKINDRKRQKDLKVKKY